MANKRDLRRIKLRNRGEQSLGRSVVPESFADVREMIDVARTEDEAPSQLERIRAKFMLVMAGFARSLSGDRIVLAK